MENAKCMSEEELELVCMEVISNAGEGRAHVYTALDLYLGGDCEKAKKELETADGYLQAAHDAHKAFALQLHPFITTHAFHFRIVDDMFAILHLSYLLTLCYVCFNDWRPGHSRE